MSRVRFVLGLGFALALGACHSDPGRVGDRFVDYYFVETNQAQAKKLATGLAARKLDDELRLVESVRREYDPAQARPSVFYERRDLKLEGDHARVTYDIKIQHGSDIGHRSVMLSLVREGDRWKVGNFIVEERAEGAGPSAPAPR